MTRSPKVGDRWTNGDRGPDTRVWVIADIEDGGAVTLTLETPGRDECEAEMKVRTDNLVYGDGEWRPVEDGDGQQA